MKAEKTTKFVFPETLQEAIKYFADQDRAFEYMKQVRWPSGKVSCPRCGCEEVSFISTRKLWTCKQCKTRKQFTIKVGTVLEDSAIPFDKWICAFWMIANAKNGISSYEIGRALGVTQKTGWFMLQRIRLALQNGSIVKMGGTVEVDETFIGAKARNLHADKRRKLVKVGCSLGTPVHGLLQRKHGKKKCSQVVVRPLSNRTQTVLQANVHEVVEKGANVMTDEWSGYQGLHADFVHQVINHAEKYVDGKVHTNGMENFWSLLKRTIKGTYVSVEPFHLFRYLMSRRSGSMNGKTRTATKAGSSRRFLESSARG